VETLAAVLRKEPDWTALPVSTPAAVRKLLSRCLRAEPRSRLHDIADARIVIEDAIESPEPVPRGASRPSRIGWLVAVLSASALVLALAASFRRADSTDVVRLSIVAPHGTTFGIRPSDGVVEPAVVSPDGEHVAFVAQTGSGDKELWVRPLASGVARVLPGTRNASLPFWSPDSRHIGFFADGKLSRIDRSGAGLRRLADVQIGYGGTWNADGVILFAPHIRSAILRVSAEGGPVEEVTLLDELDFSHRDPQFLPDGKRFLYRRHGGPENKRGVWVGAIDEPGTDRFLGIFSKVAVASGYLLYVSDGWLMAQEFDDDDLTLRGAPVTVSEERISVSADWDWWAAYSVSGTGVLVYFRNQSEGLRHLVWYDRSGRRLETLGAPGYYQAPQLSPDETQVAFSSWAESGFEAEVWRWRFGEDVPRRVASDPEDDRFPVWSPDGASIVFTSQRGPDPGPDDAMYRYELESGELELLLPSLEGGVPIPKFPLHWTRDGRYILYSQPKGRQSGRYEIWALPTFGDRSPISVVVGDADAALGEVSPDGRWVVFQDKGHDAGIFARRFPDDTGRVAVSRGFGVKPRWRADGKEIYFLAPPNLVMAVDVDAEREFRHGTPRRLFEASVDAFWFEPTPYDVTRDGQRFLFAEPIPEAPVREMRVVLNWDRALLR
jgi:Tol biopolymer transport system component